MNLTWRESVKIAMARKGITQASLAIMVGVTRPTISQILLGQSSPRIDMLRRIGECVGLAVTVDVEVAADDLG